jgi:sodium/potassium-transporting ATPase subunit alpha
MLQLAKLSSESRLDDESPIAPLASWDNFKPGFFLLTVKGAPEVLLEHCSHVLDPTGGPPVELGLTERGRITQIQEKWSSRGQRVLLLARRVIEDEYLATSWERQPEDFANVVEGYMTDLIVVGLVGLIDPLKPDIKQTVRYNFKILK